MRTQPDYGIYPWWPEDGDEWIHPEDVELARQIIPGGRVFHRLGERGQYLVIGYGEQQLRVKPTLWQPLEGEGFEMGDRVEVMSRGGLNTPGIGKITEMRYDRSDRTIHYEVRSGERILAHECTADDIRHLEHEIPTAKLPDAENAERAGREP